MGHQSSWMKQTVIDSVVQSSKVGVFSMFSMDYKAPRKYSHGRNFGVARQQDFAADIVTRRPYAPYDNGMKKGPNKLSRNLVWTSKEYKSPEGNRPRQNAANGSAKPQVIGTGHRVSNQPRKNAVYGPRSSSLSDTRGCGPRLNGSPKKSVCNFWKDGNCKKGEKCQFLHSWSCFPGLAMVAALEGHKNDIKGIALPQGSDKLFSVSGDGTLLIWDCNSGQCVRSINLQAEAGSLISEGPWVFLGLPNAVKAFNVQNSKDVHLEGVVGQVHAMTAANGFTSHGEILAMSCRRFFSIPVLLVILVMGFVYYVTLFVFIDDWVGLQSSAGKLNALLFSLLASLCLFSLSICVLVDPGRVPASYAPDVEDSGWSNSNVTETRKCDKCFAYKPLRTHHCRVCRRCVLKMDHHCLWINNCVGYANYKAFFILVFYATVASIYSTVLLVCCAFKNGDSYAGNVPLKTFIVSCGIFMIGLSITLGTLLCWHIYLITHNMTTIEHYDSKRASWLARKSGQSYRHQFDVGFYKNLTSVLGPNMIKWLCPTFTRNPEDGISFSASRDS